MNSPGPLDGRVAVVTGATSGIGREVATGLARLGATTVVVGRGEGRASAVARAIAADGNRSVDALRVDDLGKLEETRGLAAALLDKYPAIHVLVNNAGGYFHRREETPDGFERTFALNVLSPFLLTALLFPRLRASAPSRVVNVASEAHAGAHVDFEDLQSSGKYRGMRTYGRSKLELVWLTREFARRWQGTGVSVNAVHPGFVRSGFGLNNGGGTAFGMRIAMALFARSVRRGADTPLFVASSPTLASVSGEYFADRQARPGSNESRDMEKARQFFDQCSRLTGVEGLFAKG